MKIIAGIATFEQRREFLERAIESLQYQVDEIHVYDNSVNPDITDLGKFYPLTTLEEPCYFLSCDDDILYPSDYADRMVAWIEEFDGQAVITHHGRQLLGQGLNYYMQHRNFGFLRRVSELERIDVAGTGVTAFRTDVFNPCNICTSSDRRMADLVFSLEAARAGIPIYVVPHNEVYFQDLGVPHHLTCFAQEIKAPIRQGQLADEIHELRYGKARNN